MKYKDRLPHIRKWFKLAGVLHELIADRHVTIFCVMENRYSAIGPPLCEPFRSECLNPELVKAECGS